MFGDVQIIGDSASRVELKEVNTKGGKKLEGGPQKYDVIQAEIGGRKVNVYFPVDSDGSHSGESIIDYSTRNLPALFGKDGYFDSLKANASRRQMTPAQAGEENLKLRAYQILTESYLSRFSRATSTKISNGWTSVKNGASWAKEKTGSGMISTKEYYGNHPVAFKRTFLATACVVTSIVSYYIQMSFNPIGMMQNAYYGTPIV
ncbi:MAG: hypothetical protein K1000chlam1_00681 [Candidatus Anoxychlamydiales bacterium]|nr:hypothetical protein [Candidatus Anoxychlamydiales bacterium]